MKNDKRTGEEKVSKRPKPREHANDDASVHGTGHTEPDHSEREMGGDQDIDTAGMISEHDATHTKES